MAVDFNKFGKSTTATTSKPGGNSTLLSSQPSPFPTTSELLSEPQPSSNGASSAPKTGLDFNKFGKATTSIPEAPKEEERDGFLKSLVKAPATILARPVQAAAVGTAALFGGEQAANETADTLDKFSKEKLGGFVAPIGRDSKGVMQDVGRGAQTVALGVPGLATGGALFGAGSSLEQGNELLSVDTAFQTAMGAAGGKALGIAGNLVGKPLLNAAGKVVGVITPQVLKDVASKGVGAIREFAATHSILPKPVTEAAEAVASIPGKAKKELFESQAGNVENQLEQKYMELFEGASPSKQKSFFNAQKATEAKNLAGTEGVPPQRVLAEAHIIPRQEGGKIHTLEQADQFRASSKPLREANRNALKEVEKQIPRVNLLDQEEKAVQLIRTSRNINQGTAKGLEKEIRQEFADLRSHYGDDVPITILDDIKSARWQPIKFDKVDATRPLLGDANYAIAKSSQKTIEDLARSVGAEDIAQVNRHIGDIMEGAKYLESLNGRTVKGGGLFSTMGMRAAGMLMGNSIPAKIAGMVGGDLVAKMMVANRISGPAMRLILKNIEAKEGPAALKTTLKWLEEQGVKNAQPKLALPAGGQSSFKESPSFFTSPGGKTANTLQDAVDVTSRETGAIAEPKTGPSQRNKLSEILSGNEPYTASKDLPTIDMGKKPKISNKEKRLRDVYGNLPTIKGSVNPKALAAGAGLTALGAAAIPNTAEAKAPKVVKTQKIGDRTIKTLASGNEVVDIHPKIKKELAQVYKNNPDVEPGVLEALLMKESTAGYDDTNRNPKIGDYAWIGGIAGKGGARDEFKRLGIEVDLDTIPGALDAMAKYWTLLKGRKSNKGKDPIALYDKGYSSGKLKPSDIAKFKDFVDYYSNK